MANRLATETSPYLLQHKDNPVDWYPWGEEALTQAREADKPIFLSIGYSACHWCHVMEHESFENDRIASVMNRFFVPIKVDREERPDLDSIYMAAVQAMTGSGGWPLNLFLTPEGVPFFGGTYWPPEDRVGMPGFVKVLESVHDAYVNKREDVIANAEQLRAFLTDASRATPSPGELHPMLLDEAFESMVRSFDFTNGGFGGAPKFPQPLNIEFLLRYHHRTGDGRAATMVRRTLDRMAAGGIYDQLGGGFARYAVDANWLVPHFEKMLYDNALLARCYSDAFRAFGDETYYRIASETIDFALRELLTTEGGFASALDADSEGEEGRFYVWTPAEIEAVLPSQQAALLMRAYGVREGGNFEGKTILHITMPLDEVATELGLSLEVARQTLDAARSTLLTAREGRVRPGRDDKVLTSWNGLMLRTLAEGSRALNRPDFGQAAKRLAAFLLSTLRQSGRLLRGYKDGQARLNAYLEDYAFLADGLIALYETTFERRWLDAALELAQTMREEFAGDGTPLLYDTGLSHERLISRPRDLQDGAIPAGNSVAAGVLLKLAALTGVPSFAQQAGEMLRTMVRPMIEHPTAFGRMLSALDTYLAAPRELALVGEKDDPTIVAFAATVWRRYEPNLVLGLADPADPASSANVPFLANRTMKDGLATAYFCERHACLPPVTDSNALADQLDRGTGINWTEF